MVQGRCKLVDALSFFMDGLRPDAPSRVASGDEVSYEGYVRYLCANGHMTVFDCYDEPEYTLWKCPYCGSLRVWREAVDTTNGRGQKQSLTLVDKGDPGRLVGFRPAVYQIPQTTGQGQSE